MVSRAFSRRLRKLSPEIRKELNISAADAEAADQLIYGLHLKAFEKYAHEVTREKSISSIYALLIERAFYHEVAHAASKIFGLRAQYPETFVQIQAEELLAHLAALASPALTHPEGIYWDVAQLILKLLPVDDHRGYELVKEGRVLDALIGDESAIVSKTTVSEKLKVLLSHADEIRGLSVEEINSRAGQSMRRIFGYGPDK